MEARDRLKIVLGHSEAGTAVAWALVPRGADELVGIIGFHHIDVADRSAQFAYELGSKHWGQGLMTEAAQAVLDEPAHAGLYRIEAHIDPRNLRSIALVQRLMFTKEKFIQRDELVRGEWVDTEVWIK